jgi:putative nucleotidyltransferase with HDIG domain
VTASAHQDPLSILIVDDEPSVRDVIAGFLGQLGPYEVLTAENGERALELVQKHNFDCAFLDLMMPGLCGTDLLDCLLGQSPHMHVIIITGYPSLERAIDTMRHGAVDFITKPFTLNDIRTALQRLRDPRRSQRRRTLSEELERTREVENLKQELRKRSREQSILYAIVDRLSHIGNTGELCERLVHLAAELGEAERSWFTVFDETKTHLMTVAEWGLGSECIGSRFGVNRTKGRMLVNLDELAGLLVGGKLTGSMRVDALQHQGRLVAVPINIRSDHFGVLWIASGHGRARFSGEDELILRFMTEKAALAIESIALHQSVRENLVATLRALVSAIEAKDSYTEQHSKRVTQLAMEMAKVMDRTPEEIESLRLCGALHDIGKIGIRDSILNKTEILTDDEAAVMQTHPVIGDRIVEHLGLSPEERAIVRNHHERWDGTGYPDGLRGTENPLLARILAVADAFDAMTSTRTYRRGLSIDTALEDLERNRVTQFDPEPVEALGAVLAQGLSRSPKK